MSYFWLVGLPFTQRTSRSTLVFLPSMPSKITIQTFVLLLFLISLDVGDCRGNDCRPAKCQADGPEIRYPFRLKKQPQHCGYPGFELSCKPNGTVLHLPYDTTRELFVSSISYEIQRLTLFNPYDCMGDLVFSLNLSRSPFYYHFNSVCIPDTYGEYHMLSYEMFSANISFVDCPTIWFHSVAGFCPRGPGHYVYPLRSGIDLARLPDGCRKLKTVLFTFATERFHYCVGGQPTIMDDSLFILRWDLVFDLSPSPAPSALPVDYLPADYWYPNYSYGGTPAKYLTVGLSLSAAFILVLVLATIFARVYLSKKSKREESENQNVEKFLRDYRSLKPRRYSYVEIKKMTNQFKVKLGEGGYGRVFKGAFPNGTLVAVKILKMFKGDGEDFINEVSTIGRIHHINVVRLLGFCAEGFKRALIYEFMPNSSLDKFIFNVSDEECLGWEKTQSIALSIARGIEYLHQGCEQRILHFDIKPNNILLDHNFNPKIADFGLAKLCSKEQSIVSMTAARGTVGYIAPEVLSRNSRNVSYKSDVYSFGMLLLEMVGGRKNIDATAENASQVYFPEWAYNRLQQGADLGVKIETVGDGEIAKKLTAVAFWCIQWYPVDRPSMKSVVQMLERNLGSLTVPPNPFVASAMPNTEAAFPGNRNESLTVILE